MNVGSPLIIDLYLLPGRDDDLIEFYEQASPALREQALIGMIEQGRRSGHFTLNNLKAINKAGEEEKSKKLIKVRLRILPLEHPDLVDLWARLRRGQRSAMFIAMARITLQAMENGTGLMLSNLGGGGHGGSSTVELITISGSARGVEAFDEDDFVEKQPQGAAAVSDLLAGLDDD